MKVLCRCTNPYLGEIPEVLGLKIKPNLVIIPTYFLFGEQCFRRRTSFVIVRISLTNLSLSALKAKAFNVQFRGPH